jgi:hypothetical protein
MCASVSEVPGYWVWISTHFTQRSVNRWSIATFPALYYVEGLFETDLDKRLPDIMFWKTAVVD